MACHGSDGPVPRQSSPSSDTVEGSRRYQKTGPVFCRGGLKVSGVSVLEPNEPT